MFCECPRAPKDDAKKYVLIKREQRTPQKRTAHYDFQAYPCRNCKKIYSTATDIFLMNIDIFFNIKIVKMFFCINIECIFSLQYNDCWTVAISATVFSQDVFFYALLENIIGYR